MSVASLETVELAARIALGLMSIAVVLTFIRLIIGPSLSDRVVALDMFAMLLVGMLVLAGMIQGQPHPLRVAAVLALVNFVGTIAFAMFIRRRVTDD